MSLTGIFLQLLNIFFPLFDNKCYHHNVRPDVEQAYCPDCGKLIRNDWYITRCACCGVKMKAMVRAGQIIPQYHYCSNCGGEEFTVEKINKINFIDINFAVLVKQEIEEDITLSTTKCWQEKKVEQQQLLLQCR